MLNKISAEEFYDKFADNYDDAIEDSKSKVQYVNEALKMFQQRNYHQGSVLDIGCGTGL
ncbi:MAG: class I SAM-dependent methyltransferase, partial [Okeania sp. SIO1H2]|nr:class I SAM-dependent methyltransferase [Okeania sp. SIO1H2]